MGIMFSLVDKKLNKAMKTVSTNEQKIVLLKKRIKELQVFLKRETEGSKVKKLHEDISKLRDRIKELESQK